MKVVLITGTSSGIGKACAEYLAKRGYKVYGTSRFPEKSKEENLVPIPYNLIKMDINDDLSVKEGVKHLIDKEGRIDIVVNNAGYALAGAIEDTTIDEAKAQFETNLFGVLRVCREVIPIMRSLGTGIIINISSIGGLIGIPFQGMYSASKFALEGLTEVLRMEVKSFGIKVVMVEPGDFCTNITKNRVKLKTTENNKLYSKQFNEAVKVMETDETKGPDPKKIAYLIERIIKKPDSKFRYSIGPFSERAAVKLKRLLPYKTFEWIYMKYYKLL